MAYQVIARKYRPQRFSDVVGQEHVTQTLANAIAQKRIAHAYLFCGPRGTGKTTIARIFAKCLNADNGPTVDFAKNDSHATEIAEGRAMDVLEIDGASNNGVEQVRELRETCKYAPASSKFKIYIIDEVHMLSTAAFNALLKTLEEPPEHVKFMFATTEPEKVLPTILSRCQRFDLRRIPAALIVKHLAHIAKLEKVKIEPAALLAIARGAEGAMRDAESTLDQLISFCGEKIEESDVLSMFGLTAQGQLVDMARALIAGEVENALRQLDQLAKHGKDLARLLSDLLSHFRNLLLFQISRGDLKLLEVSEAEVASLKEQAGLVSTDAVTRIMEVLADAELRLRDAASKQILLEIALLKAIEARTAVSLDAALKVLQQLRSDNPGAANGSSPSPVAANVSSRTPPPAAQFSELPAAKHPPTHVGGYRAPASVVPEVADMAEASASAPGDLEALWGRLLEAVGRASQFTRSYLLEAHPVSLAKNVLTLGFDPEFQDHIGLVDNTRNHELLQTKLRELGHLNVLVKFIKAEAAERVALPMAEAPAPATPPSNVEPVAPTPAPRAPAKGKPAPTVLTQEDFKNDPLIQKALEIFKGRIVSART